jgi:hypothetical protein
MLALPQTSFTEGGGGMSAAYAFLYGMGMRRKLLQLPNSFWLVWTYIEYVIDAANDLKMCDLLVQAIEMNLNESDSVNTSTNEVLQSFSSFFYIVPIGYTIVV